MYPIAIPDCWEPHPKTLKGGIMEKRARASIVATALILSTALAVFAAAAGRAAWAADKVTLKTVSAWGKNNKMNDALWILQTKVKEASQGRLELNFVGGPETIPAFQLVEALRNGVVDVAWTAHTYNVSQVPVVEGAKLSRLTPAEERAKGVHEFYRKVYREKLNAAFLGKGTPGLTYNLYTTEPVQGIADFKGMTVRVTPAYKAFVEALGAAPVTTDPGEVFTALERKMVKGYGWPSLGISDFGWDSVTKFVVEPAFYQVDVIALANSAAWDKLPKDLQEVLAQAMQETEAAAEKHFAQLIQEDRKKITAKGVQEVKLPAAEAQSYLNTAYEAAWKEVLKKDAEGGQKLREMLAK
jgi:TRAP-type C4-dicarboxylate transport system substrate-binding protein